jgi:hypothetical protein
VGRLAELVEARAALPEGVPSPVAWGRQATVRARLGELAETLELRARSVALRFPSADAAFTALTAHTPLGDEERTALRPDFDRLLAAYANPADGVQVDVRYLLVLARKASAQASVAS